MKHACKELEELINKLTIIGFTVSHGKNNIKVFPPNKEIPFYTIHNGDKGYHPFRRYIKNVCKIKIK